MCIRDRFGTPSQAITFETANGPVRAEQSLSAVSNVFGRTEVFVLEDSPFAVPIGRVVQECGRPFLWLPGQLPFFVTHKSRLSVKCGLSCRLLADRIEANVPIWKEKIVFSTTSKAAATPAPNIYGVPGRAVDDDDTILADLIEPDEADGAVAEGGGTGDEPGEGPPPPPGPEPVLSVPDVRLESHEDIVNAKKELEESDRDITDALLAYAPDLSVKYEAGRNDKFNAGTTSSH